MISEIIMKHLWDKGQMWPLFATTAAYAMNTFASEALSGLSPFQLVFLRDPPDLTSLSFPKIDTIPVKHREYYNLLLARAQLVSNMLLEWRKKQVLQYESKAKIFRNEEIFQDNQMVYLLAVFLRDPPNLTSLSFPMIDTIPVKHREYNNLLLARAQLVGNMLLE